MPDLPPRVTMPLLTLITQQSLDEDYRLAADRRADGAPAPHRPGTRRVAAAVIAVFGVMVSTAFVQNSRNEDVDNASRDTLVSRIETQRDSVDDLQSAIADLRETNADLADRLSETSEEAEAAASQLRRLQVQTGFVPVRGEGVRVIVENAPHADPRNVVRDSDLAALADGLWSAGAEAIAINGQRLTALTAIRNSGVPIEVNRVGIAPPYIVEAIGDNDTLQADFFDTSSGLLFDALRRDNGFTYDMDNDDDLSLPAGPQRYLRLRYAADDTAADQPAPDKGGSGP